MKKDLIRIYLSEKPAPNKGKWEIYLDGQPTGEMVGNKEIRRMLTNDDYRKFINGDSIFFVTKDNFEKRKAVQNPQYHGKHTEFKIKP